MDDPEEVTFWPPIVDRRIDGSLYENFKAYQRVITINFGVVQSSALRVFIFKWLRTTDRSVVLGSEELSVALESPVRYDNEWVDNLEGARAFQVRVIEKTARASHPASWS